MTELPIVAQLHFWVGTLAVMFGFVAIIFKKGGTIHRISGRIFFYSMLLLCFSGVYLTVTRGLQFTFLLSVLTLYLLITGWYAVARSKQSSTHWDKLGLFLISLFTIASGVVSILGWQLGWEHPDTEPPYLAYLMFAVWGGWLAFSDHRFIKSTLVLKKRLMRHLLRMYASLLIATTIFFLGNNHVLPEVLRTEVILLSPIVCVLVFMSYWGVYTKWFNPKL